MQNAGVVLFSVSVSAAVHDAHDHPTPVANAYMPEERLTASGQAASRLSLLVITCKSRTMSGIGKARGVCMGMC